MKYAIVTFGCRVNQADSLGLEEDLRAAGATPSPASHADLVVVNTCSVTCTADQGARQTVRRIARENPHARIVVTGCYATRSPEDVQALPGVVRVVANADKRSTVSLLLEAGELTTAERDGDGACGLPIEPGVAGRTAFTLRVQTGCEERCSYCFIPSTRGPGRSVPIAGVVNELRRIAAAGFREIAITGVHLGSYGRDLTPRRSLAELLSALADARSDIRFRVSSLEPMDCTEEVVRLIAGSGGVFAPHFHLPLQHASDRLLTSMRRPYTHAFYAQLIRSILDCLPHASIGSDVIVGFPGETAEDFSALAEYLPVSGLSHVHVFPYSDRPGTEASRLGDRVEPALIRARGARIRELSAELSRRFRRAQIGSTRPALTLEDGSVVVTDNYMKVGIAPGLPRNQRVMVRIDSEGAGTVVGNFLAAAVT